MSTATLSAESLESIALRYLAGGLSLVPCDHRTKRPQNDLLPRDEEGKATWKPYQQSPADEATVRTWLKRGCKAVAVVCGRASGGLLVLDFDEPRFYDAWIAEVGMLASGLPVQQTGGGNYQVALRCNNPGRNDQLAWVPDENEKTGRRIAIETRGEGGYAVLPGSLHPSGRYYEPLHFDFADIPVVPQEQADALLAAARSLDEAPLTKQEQERIQATATESTKHRSESNGQVSVIDRYNEAVTIEQALQAAGYTKSGFRWVRPGGKSQSVTVKDGRSIHYSGDDPLNDRYWHRAFDLFCFWSHNGDCKAAVKAAAAQLGIPLCPEDPGVNLGPLMANLEGGSNGKPVAVSKQPLRFPRITAAELDAATYRIEYLIDHTLVAGQPCLIAGGKKSLKTSLIIDMGISLAVGGYFLGKLKINRACRVGIMSGESGMATIQETARRIASKAGYRLADVDGLVFSECLPQLENAAHVDALRRFIEEDKLEVLFLDPAYLCMSGDEAGNLFKQGGVLRTANEVCTATGCTFTLAHHCRKTGKANPFDPPELEDIAWSGFQEWGRQWLLVGRRERYEPGSGKHRLWLNVGGSAGHSALWALDISEGVFDGQTPRRWDVEVHQPDEARESAKSDQERRREVEKEQRRQTQVETDAKRLTSIMLKYPAGETGRVLRETAGLNSSRFNSALAYLLQEGHATQTTITKTGRKTPFDAYRAVDSEIPQR